MSDIDVKQRLKRDVPWIAGVISVFYAGAVVAYGGFGGDSHVYWSAARNISYSAEPYAAGAFLYSPAFAQVLWPLAQLPWPIFSALWLVLAALTFAYLLKSLGWRLAVPLWLCCTPELVFGNVFWVFALVVAFGLRVPSLWLFPLLTKVTPALGPIWFLARREWGKLVVSVIATIVVVGISVAFDPQAWRGWLQFLWGHRGMTASQVGEWSLSPMIRVPLAVILIFWGGLKNKLWTIPAAVVLATPVFWSAVFVVFAGLPRLLESAGHASSDTDA